MPKRIEPLSSRAQVVGKPAEESPKPDPKPLAQPRRMQQRRRRTPPSQKPRRSIWRKLWITFQILVLIFLVLASIAGFFVYQKAMEYYVKAETFDLKKLDDLNVTSTFYDVNGQELGRTFVEAEDRILLKPDEITDDMRHAVLAAEDRRFYEHGAIDYKGIIRAAYENITKKNRQGGSSIEQQLAKHVIGDFSRTMDRKFLEAFVAQRLERTYTKDEILNYYLNRIYFGKGYFGVGAAARGYFGKEAKDLTVPECAMLAGIIRAPVSSSPRTNLANATRRRDLTLKQMLDEGYIRKEEYLRYIKTPVVVQPAKPGGPVTYVMAAAVKEMEQILSAEGSEEIPQGLAIHTNIDLRLQHAIEDQMNFRLAELEKAANGGQPAKDAKSMLQGSVIVADAASGRVIAWVGGRDYTKSQFDHVSMARRENGALLQPLIYGLGFDRLNLTPASMINASYLDPAGNVTADDLALGDPMVNLDKWFLSVQDALALGNRPAATRVALQIGAKSFGDWLHQAGLQQVGVPDKTNIFNPDPMTLGEVTSLYQILANNGNRAHLKIIRSIQSRTGETLYDDTKADKGDRSNVLNSLNDQQLTLTLQNALRTGPARTLMRDYAFKSSIAGMPGYSDGYRDAWFVGYTPKIVAGVWIGYDDSRSIGGHDIATKSAVPLWGDIMQKVEARYNVGGAFPVPPELSKVEIDRATGALKGLAGLSPAPDDIFVYLKKSQIEAAGSGKGTAQQQLQAPKDWSQWLTTMFNDADQTGMSNDSSLTEDKRANIIPSLAEYKMPGLRGDILSSDGVVFATTGAEKNLVLSWPAADDAATDDDIVRWMHTRLDELEQVLSLKLSINDASLVSQYRTQRYQPYMVMENLTPDQVKKIEAAGLEAKGFGFQTAPLRKYPNGPELAHVLGYLSRSQQRNKGKYLSGDVIYDRYKGATGIEYVCDSDLTGKDGKFMISTTSDGYARSAVIDTPATYGNNVRLSIDSKAQAAVEQAMANSKKVIKAAILMDVHTGDIVAMASHPTFDPNIFVPGISSEEWAILNNDKYLPLMNRAIHGQYPPGSGFKTVTSLAAMRAGVFDPNWIVHCPGYLDVGSVHFSFPKEHGDIDYLEGFTHSYNTYFMSLGLKVGRDYLLDTARSLNFGSLSNIDLPGELPGLIPDNEFVKRVHNRDFGNGDLANCSIGQGDILVTPIQMVSMMAAIANDGTVWQPRLVKQVEDRNGNVISTYPPKALRTVTFDEKWLPTLKAAMINVVDDGTATVCRRDDMKIAAKTGTAQVGSKEHPRQIAWLSGFLPADNPQYAFTVVVEGQTSDNSQDAEHKNDEDAGLLGGVDAGAIAHDIFTAIFPLPGKKDKDKTASTAPPRAQAVIDDTTPTAPVTPPAASTVPAPSATHAAAGSTTP